MATAADDSQTDESVKTGWGDDGEDRGGVGAQTSGTNKLKKGREERDVFLKKGRR